MKSIDIFRVIHNWEHVDTVIDLCNMLLFNSLRLVTHTSSVQIQAVVSAKCYMDVKQLEWNKKL